MSRLLPRLLAVLAPAVLVGGTLALLARPPAPAATAATELPADVAALDALLVDGADMVVLGNSKVRSDLDLDALAAAAGMDRKRVVALNLDGTNAPIWYAVLQRRVYDQGHTPKVVVVYCTLAMMAQVELLSEALQAQLARHLGTPDPVIDHKVFGQEKVNPTWQRVLNRRTEAHTALMDGLRNAFVGLVFAPPGEGTLRERGAVVAEPALATVFNTDAMTAGERVRAVPVAEQAAATTEAAGPPDADATLIPDLIDLAKSHGSEIVFVRAPMGSLKHGHDVVPRALEEGVVARMGEKGAAWVDLSKAGPPDSGYGDGAHMNRSGRNRFTPTLIAALKEVGLGKGGPLVPATVTPSRPAPTVTRVGTAAPIDIKAPIRGKLACDYHIILPAWKPLADNVLTDARLGAISPLVVYEDDTPLTSHAAPADVNDRCTGSATHWNGALKFSPTGTDPEAGKARTYRVGLDPAAPLVGGRGEEAWWVYPGTTLRFAFAAEALAGGAAGTLPERVAAAVTALPLLPGAGTPTMHFVSADSLGGAEVALTPAGDALTAAATSAGDLSAGLTLEVSSPPNGPTLLLERLALQTGGDPWFVLGSPPRDTVVDLLAHPVTYAAPPPALPGPTAMPVEAHWMKGTWVFPVGPLGAPAMEDTAKLGATCSALRLSIDGVPAETQAEGAPPRTPLASVTHSKDRLLVRFTDPTEPRGPAGRYGYYLDPERSCGKQARWFGPGDDGQFTLEAGALSALREAATVLRIAGGAFGVKPEDQVAVTVTSGGAPVLDEVVPLARFQDGEVELRLASPLPRDAAVQVRVRSTGWLLVTFAGLAEAAPDVFAELHE